MIHLMNPIHLHLSYTLIGVLCFASIAVAGVFALRWMRNREIMRRCRNF